MKRVGAPQVSPDGRWVVVSVIEPAYDENTQLSDLWLIDASARNSTRRLTSTRRPESGVVWSPDSRRIVFSAQRDSDEAPQIYSLDLAAGGEARRLTNLSGGARAPVFSHDGRHLAFVSIMYPRCARRSLKRKGDVAAQRARKANVRIYEGFPIRNWDRWLDERQVRIFVLSLDAEGNAIGAPRDLLAGTKTRRQARDSPAARPTPAKKSKSNSRRTTRPSCSPRPPTDTGRACAFPDSQLFVVDVDGGEPRQITTGMDRWAMPRFTPDGRTLIAVVEQQGDNRVQRRAARGHAVAGAGRPHRSRTASIASVDTYAISPDSNRIYFTAEDAGNYKMFSVRVERWQGADLVRRRERVVHEHRRFRSAPKTRSCSRTGKARARPAEVAIATSAGRQGDRADPIQRRRAAQLDLPPVEHFWFTSSRGKPIHSLVVRPPGFDSAKKYPLFVVIHGGPHGMWRDQFFIRWNYHLLSAPGYVLLLTNYSGSTGFGEQFARSIQGDPFKGPADEINEAADAAISRVPFIDGERQCAGGASYGGHLANWLQGTTTRYKCLVSHAGLVNLEAQWGTSDTIYSARDQHGRTAVGTGRGLARAEPDPARGEIPHADAGDRR